MDHTGNNRLVSNYNNYQGQHNNYPFQNNNLLMNGLHQGQMGQQQQHILQMKQMQQIKQMERLNELDLSVDKDKIRESIIKPIKIEKNKQDRVELEKKWKESENNYMDSSGKDFGQEVRQYWAKRTNQPYKNIMKNEDYTKKIASDKDLIVHRVTSKDKEGVEEGYIDLKGKLEKHDDELKVIYSTSKKNEHKKKFEYNHVYKYRMQDQQGENKGKDHEDLKEDRIKYYKAQQKKEEIGKKKKDILFDALISDGIFDKEELANLTVDTTSNISSTGSPENGNSNSNSSNTNHTHTSKPSKKDKYLERKNRK
ncbi:MAG: hypothetical protein Barrevirus23_3 [Barrevirus sp.]|uniref:Uncharacterized protein n=1 Tax=Barrevirus sp. TaxID=2487763 RepID=A0A3G4ZQR8_9VIRU|nr:MAG: hypothetical protein Barrevirus23_3 [Barrevirus sp.]